MSVFGTPRPVYRARLDATTRERPEGSRVTLGGRRAVTQDDVKILRRSALFRGIPARQLLTLTRGASVRLVKRGDVLIRQGDPPTLVLLRARRRREARSNRFRGRAGRAGLSLAR